MRNYPQGAAPQKEGEVSWQMIVSGCSALFAGTNPDDDPQGYGA